MGFTPKPTSTSPRHLKEVLQEESRGLWQGGPLHGKLTCVPSLQRRSSTQAGRHAYLLRGRRFPFQFYCFGINSGAAEFTDRNRSIDRSGSMLAAQHGHQLAQRLLLLSPSPPISKASSGPRTARAVTDSTGRPGSDLPPTGPKPPTARLRGPRGTERVFTRLTRRGGPSAGLGTGPALGHILPLRPSCLWSSFLSPSASRDGSFASKYGKLLPNADNMC